MAKISISEAARLAGISRSALYRGYISKGKLTVERDKNNAPMVDTSELFRVFGETAKRTGEQGIDQISEQVSLREEVARLRALVEVYERQLQEDKEREDWLRRKIDQLQPPAIAGPETRRRWWWPW
jgi:predicted site-specific integrase-resolvase